MSTPAHRISTAFRALALGLAFGPVTLGAQTASAESSAEMRFWDWTNLEFPAEEYAGRRGRLLDALADDGGGILIVPGAHGTSHGTTFRQLDDFHYLTGLEVPASILALDADRREVTLFTPPRDPRFENPGRPNDSPADPWATIRRWPRSPASGGSCTPTTSKAGWTCGLAKDACFG